jgi:hypothetical protein
VYSIYQSQWLFAQSPSPGLAHSSNFARLILTNCVITPSRWYTKRTHKSLASPDGLIWAAILAFGSIQLLHTWAELLVFTRLAADLLSHPYDS